MTRPIGRFWREESPVSLEVKFLARENSGEEADGRAGVAGVESAPTALQAFGAASGDLHDVFVDFYGRAEGAHAVERAVTVDGGGEMA